jgi:hypothetical protein
MDFGDLIYWVLTIGVIVFGALSKKKKEKQKTNVDFFGEEIETEKQVEPSKDKLGGLFDFLVEENEDRYSENLPGEMQVSPVVEDDVVGKLDAKNNIYKRENKRKKEKNIEIENVADYDDVIDWRQAIIHSEILNRKYF